MTLMNKT